MKPLVSIIVPVYNSERKITRCIESILKQNYKPKEIFVVDDGSNDNTLKILEGYSQKINILKQERRGPGAAKNLAVLKSSGKILVFVDSDEYLLPDYIEKITRPIRAGKVKASLGTWKIANPSSPWARCLLEDSSKADKYTIESGIFRAILKKRFNELGGFNVKRGYSDDRIPNDEKIERIDSAIYLHDVDSTLKDIYKKRKWIGSSIIKNPKNRKFKIKIFGGILALTLATILMFIKPNSLWFLLTFSLMGLLFILLKKAFFYRDFRLIFYYPVYLLLSTIAMIHGLMAPVYKN